MKEEIEALEKALNGDCSHLLKLGRKESPIEAAIDLLSYKVCPFSPNPADYETEETKKSGEWPYPWDWHENPGDYSIGAEVRALAARLLGEVGDERTLKHLENALHDCGDDNGCSLGRCCFYSRNEKLVPLAAKFALYRLRARGIDIGGLDKQIADVKIMQEAKKEPAHKQDTKRDKKYRQKIDELISEIDLHRGSYGIPLDADLIFVDKGDGISVGDREAGVEYAFIKHSFKSFSLRAV